MAEADVLAAIAALDAKLGTIVNTGGTASVGAILGDFANTNLNTRVADLHTDVATVDGIVDLIKTAAEAILVDTGTTLDAALTLALKLLRNKVVTNPATGVMTVYDDNGSTPLYTANVYEDIAGTLPFDGTGANRRDRLA